MGKDFDFPKLERCLNAKCRNQIIHKHGFYERNCCDGFKWHRIFIRRYYCPKCGLTVSFLPVFCLPWFQYNLICFMSCLRAKFINNLSLNKIRHWLKKRYPKLSWPISQIHRYIQRFLGNLPKIELVLRSINPNYLLEAPLDKIKRAKKVLDIIARLVTPQSFLKLYIEQCQSSFLAPNQ
ncbi:MAG: hypothetical protein WBJ28_00575 [Bacilli bacterium]|jgi:hypothetical protein